VTEVFWLALVTEAGRGAGGGCAAPRQNVVEEKIYCVLADD
jgi:hypothetical protein